MKGGGGIKRLVGKDTGQQKFLLPKSSFRKHELLKFEEMSQKDWGERTRKGGGGLGGGAS